MKSLTNELQKSYENAKICYICEEKTKDKHAKKKYCNYNYHCIMKELADEFNGWFTCLGESTEKYITFSVPIEKQVTRIDKKRKRKYKSYILKITIYWQRKIYGKLIIKFC